MTLRGRFIALTYDHQIAKVEKAGLGALRQGLLADARGRVAGDRRRNGGQPALLRSEPSNR